MHAPKVTLAALVIAGSMVGGAADGDTSQKRKDLPRNLEIELALSALPPHLREEATVYVLGPAGTFDVARPGHNGFHTFVSRLDPNVFSAEWAFTEYRDDLLVPIAFDSAGVKAHMRVFFDMAALRAEGTTAAELKSIMRRRYESGYYPAPERAGLSYMLSPVVRTYMDAEMSDQVSTWNVPHYMFYAPGVSNEQIGGKFMSEYPYMLNRSPGPHGYIIQFVGKTEREAINREHAGLIARLCTFHADYCLAQ